EVGSEGIGADSDAESGRGVLRTPGGAGGAGGAERRRLVGPHRADEPGEPDEPHGAPNTPVGPVASRPGAASFWGLPGKGGGTRLRMERSSGASITTSSAPSSRVASSSRALTSEDQSSSNSERGPGAPGFLAEGVGALGGGGGGRSW